MFKIYGSYFTVQKEYSYFFESKTNHFWYYAEKMHTTETDNLSLNINCCYKKATI